MLQAKDLVKQYGTFTALKGLNLSVNPCEIYCLLGANGAGKSTTIALFLNMIKPTQGAAYINNLEVSKQALECKKQVAYIPENLILYPQLSGLENLAYFAGLSGKHYKKEELGNLLAEAGLQSDAFKKRVIHYSKGMRQKTGIALALAKEAKALLLDEPASGLDPRASNEFAALLIGLREKGMAALMTTHDLFGAKQVGTHIGIMKEGVLLKSFESREVSLEELETLYLETVR